MLRSPTLSLSHHMNPYIYTMKKNIDKRKVCSCYSVCEYVHVQAYKHDKKGMFKNPSKTIRAKRRKQERTGEEGRYDGCGKRGF